MAGLMTLDPVRERFAEAVASMSARDRKLLAGLAVFGVLAVLGGTWWLGSGLVADARSRVSDREDALDQLTTMASQQADAVEQVENIEAELRKHASQDLPSFMEKSAQKTNLATNLSGVREKEVRTEGNLEEKVYGVELAKVSLQQLVEFLHEIETSGYPLRVRSTKTKTVTVAGAKVLNVSMEVSAFRLVEVEAEPAPAEEKSP